MDKIDQLLHIMSRLRRECPWDARQTHESLKRYLLEETYEVMEAIDSKSWEALKCELGDILLQVVFHSALAEEENKFSFNDVVEAISRKMIKRHPHVFNKEKGLTAEKVQQNWEKQKHKEESRRSLLQGVSPAMPALLRAQRLQEKAAAVGFDWSSAAQVKEKLREEWLEFLEAERQAQTSPEREELGDMLFTLVNYIRKKEWVAEELLQQANNKFITRFNYIEKKLNHDVEKLHEASLEELDRLWDQAKKEIE